VTFKRAPKAELPAGENRTLFGETDSED